MSVTTPTISGIDPSSGPAGIVATVSGSGFTGATSVLFGGTPSANITPISDTQIIAVPPPGNTGKVDVTVTNAAGTSVISAADQFDYTVVPQPPAITNVNPGSGPGGTMVAIAGTGLTGLTSVEFGAAGAASATPVSDTQVMAISPLAGAGTVDITVTTPVGTSVTSTADQFTFVAASNAAATAPVGGGTPIAGTGVVNNIGASPGTSSQGYYIDPGLSSQLVGSIVNILQTASSPDALEAQNIILRRIALQGDIVGSRIPPPRNISEIGGYINLLATLKQPEMRSQALAGILGVAGPTQALGWVSNNQPFAFVTQANDRPAGAAQPSISLTFLVRSDFISAVQSALNAIHQQGCTLPISGSSAISLPEAAPGAFPPPYVLPYLGRTLDLVAAAALQNPQTDPLALVRKQGSSDAFQIASNMLTPGSVAVPLGNYDAVQCNTNSCSIINVMNGQYVLVAPLLATAGFYPTFPLLLPTSLSTTEWTHFTNITGTDSGSNKTRR